MAGRRSGEQATTSAIDELFGGLARPIQAFFRLESASGVILLLCAVVALAWANLGGSDTYRAVFDYQIRAGAGTSSVQFTLLELVNDGLMTVFFFVVGMEIKRELVVGELRTPARAMLPGVAALGGMIVPAGIYFALNRGQPGQPGWAIPMATDIAFCIGCLTLLKRRVPNALIVFVTALAIFDDIGGILVIALFYGAGLALGWLLLAAAITVGLALMSRQYVRSGAAYACAGAALWYALHHAGIHATIAGVVLGLAIPARPTRRPREVLERLSEHSRNLIRKAADDAVDSEALSGIEHTLSEMEPPLDRFVHALHPWVAFVVMPTFALANSGVALAGLEASQLTGRIALGAALGLFVGKQLGIFAFTLAAIRLGLAPAPGNASMTKVFGVSIVAGIGFTVALFIAGLAFPGDPHLLDEAKFGIICGSFASGIAGCALLAFTRPLAPSDGVDEATPNAVGGG